MENLKYNVFRTIFLRFRSLPINLSVLLLRWRISGAGIPDLDFCNDHHEYFWVSHLLNNHERRWLLDRSDVLGESHGTGAVTVLKTNGRQPVW